MPNTPNAKPPTLHDVAAATGVSAMTVSRILNGRGGASKATCERVLAAARDLSYQPNDFAKSLKANRSYTVGVVVPDIVNPFFPEIIRGAELVARPAGYMLLSCNIVEDPAREEEVIKMLLAKRVDGVIICSARLGEQRLLRAIKPHRAVVLINRLVPSHQAGTIDIDYRSGVEAATEALIRSGRTRIAYASGPPTSYSGMRRRQGIHAALDRQGLRLVDDIPSSPGVDGGADVARRVLDRISEIDAVVCYNDLIAIALMASLQTEGVNVPDDLALVGCDDIMAAALVHPALTTLRVAKQDVGEMAMRMLLDRMDGNINQERIVVRPELVVRGSS